MSKTRLTSAIVAVTLTAIAFSAATAGTFTAYGPRTHPGETARTSPVVEGFSVADPSAEYVLRVTRQNRTGPRVRINGVLVVRASDFSESDQVLERPIILSVDNEVSLTIVGNPHGTVTLEIYGTDDAVPVIDYVVTPDGNAAGWHDSDATVIFECADQTAGIAQCTPPVVIRDEGAGQTVTGLAIDHAGNRAMTTATVHLDKTPPALSAAPEGPPDDDGNIIVSGTIIESTSGIDDLSCEGLPADVAGTGFSCSLSLNAGTNEAVIAATDRAGNRTTTTLRDLKYVPTTDGSEASVITSPAIFALLGPEDAPEGYVEVAGIVPASVDAAEPTVNVDGVVAEVSPSSNPPGWSFTAQAVPLREGHNILTATVSGSVQRTASVFITLDTTPVDLYIETPANDSVVVEPRVTVTGRVHDRVSSLEGSGEPQVTVNGVVATVSNGTFAAFDVPLKRGPNTLEVHARDDAGNEATRSVAVTLVESASQHIRVHSGEGQEAAVGEDLPEPLVAVLTGADGEPIAGRLVKFEVTRGAGTLSDGMVRERSVLVPADGDGLARAWFRIGKRSGAGNHRIRASAVGFAGEAPFVASAASGPAAAIKMVGGANQSGETGQRLPEPFVAFVHDAHGNPVSGAPVDFEVLLGDGKVDGQSRAVTDRSGVAAAFLRLGSEPGVNTNLVTASLVAPPGGAAGDGRGSMPMPAPMEPGGLPGLSPLHETLSTGGAAVQPGGEPQDSPSPLPVAFFASGQEATDAGTSLRGIALDQSGEPLAGATVRVHHATLADPLVGTTDGNGEFSVASVPVGRVDVEIDGSTLPSGSWAPLRYELTTIDGHENTINRTIHLVEIDESSEQPLGLDVQTMLAMADVPGMELIVPPGAVSCPEADDPEGCLATLTQVHADTLPATPPAGVSPRLAWTVQPDDLEFEPHVVVETPNVDDLLPGQVIDLFALDLDRAEFVRVGTGTVSEDGSVVRAELGTSAGTPAWGFTAAPPPAPTCVIRCDDGNQCTDDLAVEPCQCENVVIEPSEPGGTVTCDDGLYCTEPDTCKDAVCGGVPVADVESPVSFEVAIEFDFGSDVQDATEAMKYGPCDVEPPGGLSFGFSDTDIEKCCESESQAASQRIIKEGHKYGGSATVSLLTVECPVPGLSIKINKPKVTLGLVVGLVIDGQLEITNESVECSGATCDIAVSLSLGLTLYGEVKIETPLDSVISFSASVSAGGRLILAGTCEGECGTPPTEIDFDDFDKCDVSVQACIGPIKLSASAKLFAFFSVSYSFNVAGTQKCWPP